MTDDNCVELFLSAIRDQLLLEGSITLKSLAGLLTRQHSAAISVVMQNGGLKNFLADNSDFVVDSASGIVVLASEEENVATNDYGGDNNEEGDDDDEEEEKVVRNGKPVPTAPVSVSVELASTQSHQSQQQPTSKKAKKKKKGRQSQQNVVPPAIAATSPVTVNGCPTAVEKVRMAGNSNAVCLDADRSVPHATALRDGLNMLFYSLRHFSTLQRREIMPTYSNAVNCRDGLQNSLFNEVLSNGNAIWLLLVCHASSQLLQLTASVTGDSKSSTQLQTVANDLGNLRAQFAGFFRSDRAFNDSIFYLSDALLVVDERSSDADDCSENVDGNGAKNQREIFTDEYQRTIEQVRKHVKTAGPLLTNVKTEKLKSSGDRQTVVGGVQNGATQTPATNPVVTNSFNGIKPVASYFKPLFNSKAMLMADSAEKRQHKYDLIMKELLRVLPGQLPVNVIIASFQTVLASDKNARNVSAMQLCDDTFQLGCKYSWGELPLPKVIVSDETLRANALRHSRYCPQLKMANGKKCTTKNCQFPHSVEELLPLPKHIVCAEFLEKRCQAAERCLFGHYTF